MKRLYIPIIIIIIIITVIFWYKAESINEFITKKETEQIYIYLNIRKYTNLYSDYGYDKFDYNGLDVKDTEIKENIKNIISNIEFTNKNPIPYPVSYDTDQLFGIQHTINNNTQVIYFFDDPVNGGLFAHNADSDLKYGYLNYNDRVKLFNIFEHLKDFQ